MTKRARWFADPNGPAYRTGEHRVGPPLDYVGEKLRRGLECQHGVLHALSRAAAAAGRDGAGGAVDAGAGAKSGGAAPAPSFEVLAAAARIAFDYQLTAFLALYNTLGAKGDADAVDRLAAMTPDAFRRWLGFVEREGSVTGG